MLRMEKEALKKEKDLASRERRAKVEHDIANLDEELHSLKLSLESEREPVEEIHHLKRELEQKQGESVRTEREVATEYARYGRANFESVNLLKTSIGQLEQSIQEKEAELSNRKGERMLREEVNAEDIAEIVSKWTHIPVTRLMEGEVQKLLTMEDRLRERVVGQELALQTVSDAIRRSRAGLQDPNRPLASFIFLGLTDGQGRTVDFKNTVIIMTSNVGTAWLHEFDGMDEDEIQRVVRQRLREEGFRPEFINRIDEVIVFHQITRDQMKNIVDIQINRLRPRLAERHITLRLSDSAREQLADMGYDPQYGARPLKRVIQREVENRIARAILDGTVRDGDTVEIDAKGGKLVLEKTYEHQ